MDQSKIFREENRVIRIKYVSWFINQEFNWLIAEAIFGSYWSIIEGIKNEGDINTTRINKVDLGRKSILSIINAQSFNKKQYWKILQSHNKSNMRGNENGFN